MSAALDSSPTTPTTPLQQAVWSALGTVRDPELDESLTELGFVSHCAVDESGHAEVKLRLPTYFCAPNFAFLMVADSHDAVCAVPGVREVVVELEDHFAAEMINRGVAAQAGFVASFTGEAVSELDELRADFLRRAMLAGTDRVCRALLAAGTTQAELARMVIGDVPESADLDRLRARRRDLGLPCSAADALIVDAQTGEPVPEAELRLHLGRARLTRVSQEANAGVCRGMLLGRYPEAKQQESRP